MGEGLLLLQGLPIFARRSSAWTGGKDCVVFREVQAMHRWDAIRRMPWSNRPLSMEEADHGWDLAHVIAAETAGRGKRMLFWRTAGKLAGVQDVLRELHRHRLDRAKDHGRNKLWDSTV